MISDLTIVLDTNVLLVALPTRSPYRPIFDHLLTATYELVVSNEILAEYEEQIAERYDHAVVEESLLRTGDEETRIWLASRILESARYADVWRYLSLAELRALFPHLKLKPPVREAWAYALQVWETAASNGR